MAYKGLLKQLYNDPKTGFVNAKQLYERSKTQDPSIRLKDVKEWYANQMDIQRLKEQRSSLPLFKIASHNPNSWQADLTFLDKKTIFAAININSRIGYAMLLKDKKASTVLTAIKTLCKKYKVEIITTDNGSEFMNQSAQNFFKGKSIDHYNNEPGDHSTMGKIERFNRTLKQRLMRMDTVLTNKLLNDTIVNYNETYHSAIRATPNEMKGKVIHDEIEHNQKLDMTLSNELTVGDRVLYRLAKKTFAKESVRWSKTVYTIVGFDGYRVQIRSKNNHTLYKPYNDIKTVQAEATDAPIENNQIWEVERILEHRSLKNGKNQYLIKWKEYTEPTWESQDNLRLINKNKQSALEKQYFAHSDKRIYKV